MSFTYTDYHHRQFDRQFSLPLPMPSPTSCWYPQRQDVQFGYSYPDPEYTLPLQIAQPHPPTCWNNPWQPSQQYQQLPQTNQQPPQTNQHPLQPSSVSYACPEPDPPDGPPMYTAAQPPYQTFQPLSPPYQPPYNSVTEPLGMPCDPVMSNSEPNLPMAALVSQLERLTAIVKDLESQMYANERCLGDPHAAASPMSHCRTATPLHAAATVLSLNLPPPAPPCSSDINGDAGEVLDDDPPPAVISQPGGPNTSPTLIPHVVLAAVTSLINMEMSESVKRDCSGSSLGKRITMEEFHNLDDISFNDGANPNHGEDASFNSFCDSALDADARLIPPRTNQFGMPGMEDIERDPIILAREDAQSMNLTEANVNLIATIAKFETPLEDADRHVDNLQPDPDPPYDLHEYDLTELTLFSREDLLTDDVKDFSLDISVELSEVTDVEDSKINEEHGDLREDAADDLPVVDISKIELSSFISADEQIDVDVFDPASDYVKLRESILDFQTFRKLFSYLKLTFCYYALNGVAGAFARRIFVEELGAKESSLLNCAPNEDFGRGHPYHNLTYARELVARVGVSKSDNNPDQPEFGAAVDGDADHNIASFSTSRVSAKQKSCTFDPGGSISEDFARDWKKIEAYVQWVLKQVKIIGVEPFDITANAMLLSLHLDRGVELNQAGVFVAKGAVMELDKENFHLCSKELTKGMRLVRRSANCASITNMFEEIWSILKLPLVGAEIGCN